jgi:Protein of unknown function (DUF2631)
VDERSGEDARGEVTQPHRHERPEDWGWHGEAGRWARLAGWISAIALVVMNLTTHYNNTQDAWLYGIAAIIVLLLIRDWYRRRNAWRS